MKPYRPHGRTAEILDRAWEHKQSVPYSVSLRWLFYRLLQEGIYHRKEDYDHLKDHLADARKRFYKNWRPWSVVDDTRVERGTMHGHLSEDEWLEGIRSLGLELDRWVEQRGYGIIAFEARAMIYQFEHYVPRAFSLWPFGGDASIEFKWRLAQHIINAAERYGKPVTLFYFGDLDPKGEEIPQNALEDLQDWAPIDFDFVRGGLNPGHETRFDVPENPDRPGDYQWEALTDEAARTLILEALGGFYDPGVEQAIRRREERATEAYHRALDGLEL